MRRKRLALQMLFFLFSLFLYPPSAMPNSSFFGEPWITPPSSKISGQFPGDVTNLLALRLLDVSGNILNGSLPSNIISKLMDVSDNSLSSDFPLDLSHLYLRGNLSVLRSLNISYNQLKGSLPSNNQN